MEASGYRSLYPGPLVSRWGHFGMPEAAATVVASALAGILISATGDYWIAAAAGVGLCFGVLGAIAPFAFLGVFLLVRPLVDGISEHTLAAGINTAGALAGLVIVVAGTVVFTRGHPTSASKISLALVGLAATSAAAAALTFDNFGPSVGREALNELGRLVGLMAIFVLAYKVAPQNDRVRRLFVIVALSAVVPALVGIVEWRQGIAPEGYLDFGRLDGTFFHPNAFAVHMALAALILIHLPRDDFPTGPRLVALAPILIALLGSYSRTGWVFLLLGLLFLEVRQRRLLLAVTAVGVTIVVFSLGTVQERIFERRSTPVVSAPGAGLLPSSMVWRISNWEYLIKTYGDRPLTGYGLRTTEVVNPLKTRRAPGVQNPDNPTGFRGFAAHNGLVRALVEGGPLLLGAYLALFAAAITTLSRAGRREWPLRPYARLLAVVWVIVFIIGATSTDALNSTALLLALLSLTGAVEGAHRLELSRTSDSA